MLRTTERQALRHATGAVLAIGDDGRIAFATPDARRLLGWDEGLLGQSLSAIVPERLHGSFRTSFGRYVAKRGHDAHGTNRVHRHPARLRDGSERPMQIHVQGYRRPDGSLFVCAGLAHDPGPEPPMESLRLALATLGYQRT